MWFWLCILALCSLVDYASWTVRIIIPRDKLRFVKRHLDIEAYVYGNSKRLSQKRVSTVETRGSVVSHRGSRPSNAAIGDPIEFSANEAPPQPHQSSPQSNYIDIEKEKRLMREFTFSYLKDDGIFALRIMASSASDLIVTEIMSELWKNFKLNYEQNDEVSTLVSSPSSSSSQSSSLSSASHVSCVFLRF